MPDIAPQLEAALDAGQTVVVPTAQRAAALRLAVAARHLAAGRRAFRTPDVRSLEGWLRGHAVHRGPDGRELRRLGALEEWLLWHEAVTDAAARLSLPAVAGLVDAVHRSAAVMFEWRIPASALAHAVTPEAALLRESLAAIDARLIDLSAAGSWRMLQDLAAEPPARVPVFAGFHEVTPARRALMDAWEQRGRAPLELACGFSGAAAAIARPADPAQELAQVAHWCRERLRAAPAARLLVIVPDLGERRAAVRRIFEAALDPEYLHRGADEAAASAFALEGGVPLLDHAPVAEGVSTLALLSSEMELGAVSAWLRGGFAPRPAATARARLDVWLRTVLPPRLNGRQLLQALRAAPPGLLGEADELAAIVARALDLLDAGSRATLGAWGGRFAGILALGGLTAGAARQRGSHTQQILQRLDELLQEWAALPATLGTFGAPAAVSMFAQCLARTRFEPATGDAAVTLTASLADPLLRYDGIWASGLHSGALPAAVHFDPFIPAALQREARVSAADPATRLHQARQALSTLCRSSREFIVSAPLHAGDQPQVASPLLAPYASRSHEPPADPADDLAPAIRAARRIETYVDESGMDWPGGVPLPAGTRAIELQSRCPFRAYAQLRLGAEPLESPSPGITPRERGRLLHRALELLWQRLGGSQGLAGARAAQSLAPTVTQCVAQAAGEILHGTDPEGQDEGLSAAADATGLRQLRRAAIARELGRAERLIGALCELEAGRTSFEIQALEASRSVQLGGTLINVRIDRIDRLADGTHAILDYKSGLARSPDWDEARTTHPQLLVYLLAAGVPVSALAVAHLAPRTVEFRGIGDEEGRLPGLARGAEWDRQLALWREQVSRLAGDFSSGQARVDPMDGACDQCHLHALCRIAERADVSAG
ncbi:MAG TPA: PD-(D/E)XK nuclease family protein [Steroidobacteraceae bacterium]|nr:PD-(D/E)XK nuclease family protein [Steroidobacteraceae bacterium]